MASLYQRQAGWETNCGPAEGSKENIMENEAGGRAKLVTFHMTSPTNTKATDNFLSFFGMAIQRNGE